MHQFQYLQKKFHQEFSNDKEFKISEKISQKEDEGKEKINKIYVKNMNLEVKIEQPIKHVEIEKNVKTSKIEVSDDEKKKSDQEDLKTLKRLESKAKEFSENILFNVEKYMNMIDQIDKKRNDLPNVNKYIDMIEQIDKKRKELPNVDKYMDMIKEIENKRKEEEEKKKIKSIQSTNELIDVSKYIKMIDNIDNKKNKKSLF